jgi:hypothetical protein
METKTFKAEEVYTAITLNDVKLAYRPDSKLAGQFYYTGRWGNRGFTCSERFAVDFKNKNIAQLSIQESEYQRVDPATGKEVTMQSATLMGYDTFDGQINLQEKIGNLEVAIAKREIKVGSARMVAIADLNLKEADVERLLKMA